MAFDLSNQIELPFACQDVKLFVQHPVKFDSNQGVYSTEHSSLVLRAVGFLFRLKKATALQQCYTREEANCHFGFSC